MVDHGLLAEILLAEVALIPVAILLHELGHAAAVKAVGWQLRGVVVGGGRPLVSLSIRGVPFTLGRGLFWGGLTHFLTVEHSATRIRSILVFLAGPAVNLLLLALFGGLWLRTGGQEWLLGVFAGANLVSALSLLPWDNGAVASDGMQLWRHLSAREHLDVLAPRLVAEVRAGRVPESVTTAQQILALYRWHTLANMVVSESMIREKAYQAAVAHLTCCTAPSTGLSGDGLAMLQNLYAWARLRSETPTVASETLAASRAALARRPDLAAFMDTCGEALVRSGQVDEGMVLLERVWAGDDAEALKPESRAFTACALAQGWAARGDRAEASRWISVAVGFDADCVALGPTRCTIQ